MARRTVITLTDDIDGSEATETVGFGLDGDTHEIDLNDEHAADLREVMSVYVGAARRAGGAASAVRAPPARPGPGHPKRSVRRLSGYGAEADGIEVNAHGRLKADVGAAGRAVGWARIILDWRLADPALPVQVLRRRRGGARRRRPARGALAARSRGAGGVAAGVSYGQ